MFIRMREQWACLFHGKALRLVSGNTRDILWLSETAFAEIGKTSMEQVDALGIPLPTFDDSASKPPVVPQKLVNVVTHPFMK